MNATLNIQELPAAATEVRRLRIDPSRSRIYFRLRWLGPIAGRGNLAGINGTVDLDEQQPERSSARATVDLTTIKTGIARRDQHLRAADFFDVERYPQAEFASNIVERVGSDRWYVHGTLDLHGVRQPVVLDLAYEELADRAARFAATTSLSRSAFGIHSDSLMKRVMLGDTVQLNFTITAVPEVSNG